MKIAIHKSNWGFSKEWINYCEKNKILYKIVNCYSSDIIDQLQDCDTLLWHHHHTDAKDVLFAKGLLFSLEQAGKKVFPEFNSGWHFDDKVGALFINEESGSALGRHPPARGPGSTACLPIACRALQGSPARAAYWTK